MARTDRPRTGVSYRQSSRPVSGSSATTPPFCSVMYMMLLMTAGVFCHFRPIVLVSNSHARVSRVTFCGVICVRLENFVWPGSFPYVFQSFCANAPAVRAMTQKTATDHRCRDMDPSSESTQACVSGTPGRGDDILDAQDIA